MQPGLGFASTIGSFIGGAAKQINTNIETEAEQDRQDQLLQSVKADKAISEWKKDSKTREAQTNLWNTVKDRYGEKAADTAISILGVNPKTPMTDVMGAASMVPSDPNYKSTYMDRSSADSATRIKEIQDMTSKLPAKYRRQMPSLQTGSNTSGNNAGSQGSPFTSTQPQGAPAQPTPLQQPGPPANYDATGVSYGPAGPPPGLGSTPQPNNADVNPSRGTMTAPNTPAVPPAGSGIGTETIPPNPALEGGGGEGTNIMPDMGEGAGPTGMPTTPTVSTPSPSNLVPTPAPESRATPNRLTLTPQTTLNQPAPFFPPKAETTRQANQDRIGEFNANTTALENERKAAHDAALLKTTQDTQKLAREKFDYERSIKPESYEKKKEIDTAYADADKYLHAPKDGLQARYQELGGLQMQSNDVNSLVDILERGFKSSKIQPIYDELNRYFKPILGVSLEDMGVANTERDQTLFQKDVFNGIINRLSQLHFGRITNYEAGMVQKGFPAMDGTPNTNLKIALSLQASIDAAKKQSVAEYTSAYGPNSETKTFPQRVQEARNAKVAALNAYINNNSKAPWAQIDGKSPDAQKQMQQLPPGYFENKADGIMYQKSPDGTWHKATL